MIKRLCVTGLNESMDYDLIFNEDINILTGKNGSGKTTILKLIWYMYSPNVERIVPEIKFKTAHLDTKYFSLDISRTKVKKREKVNITFKEGQKKALECEVWADEKYDPIAIEKVEQVNRRIYEINSSSVFFPTFRRIEGGFSLDQDTRRPSTSFQIAASMSSMSTDLSRSIAGYSRRMTVKQHRFIASISTEDIEDLLTKQFADISEQTNSLHSELSSSIKSIISKKEKISKGKKTSVSEQLLQAHSQIENIRKKVDSIEEKREMLMQPFNVLSDIISDIFRDKGIKITTKLILGKAKEAIQANILSAGEKQLLSFLCYNAFTRNSPIFIDEPELSLHVDWQRLLLPTLLSQNTANQFFTSTHSPFIYSKYPEKELILDKDRGDYQCH